MSGGFNDCLPYGPDRLKESSYRLACLQRKVTVGELCDADNLVRIIDAYEELADAIEHGTGVVVVDPKNTIGGQE